VLPISISGFTVATHTLINPSHRSIDKALIGRMDEFLGALDDQAMAAYLANTVFLERSRFSKHPDGVTAKERDRIEGLARALTQGPVAMRKAAGRLVRAYSREIHNRFSDVSFSTAMRLAPAALTRLLSPADSGSRIWPEADGADRVVVSGPIDKIRALAEHHTLIIAPTHVSNLDSLLVGYALHLAGLPACTYGAGLNLFSNPVMGFLMSKLGAYTVDRRKGHRLYKDVLKAYSTELIGRGAHSLFYPGGTRSRSGCVETALKRGLLGTGIVAWQEGLAEEAPSPEVLVVPVTLSCSLVLEAETLIEDALSADGGARYIISDDEFSRPSTVLKFAQQLIALDTSVVVRFGAPMDTLGNPVDEQGLSMDGDGRVFDRRLYVTDRCGKAVEDTQRDREYTNHLAKALLGAYQRDTVVLPTHLAAFVGWHALGVRFPRLDTYNRALLAPFEQWVDRSVMVAGIAAAADAVDAAVLRGRCRSMLPTGKNRATEILTMAVDAFSGVHTRQVLSFEDWRVLVDPKLSLYYGNRLSGLLSPKDIQMEENP